MTEDGRTHVPDASELAGIIKDAADCLHGNPENYCSWSMANAAAEAVEKRIRSIAALAASLPDGSGQRKSADGGQCNEQSAQTLSRATGGEG